MARATKVTYTLDQATIDGIERTAARLGIPRSGVVREAIAEYVARTDRLSDGERRRLLTAFDELVPKATGRPAGAAKKEIAAIRSARRAGWLREATPGDK